MSQTLDSMVFRSFLGGISGIDTATGSSATGVHVEYRGATKLEEMIAPAEPAGRLFRWNGYVAVEQEVPASELTIEGKAEVIIDEASQIPDDVWRYVEETLLLIEEISK
jgi:hypothetical protein